MSEIEFNKIFAERLRYHLSRYDMTQVELATRVGVSKATVSNWINGVKTPRMDKLDKMCEIFNCRRTDFIEVQEDGQQEAYYQDEEVREIANWLYEHPDHKVLFRLGKKVKASDLDTVSKILGVYADDSDEL